MTEQKKLSEEEAKQFGFGVDSNGESVHTETESARVMRKIMTIDEALKYESGPQIELSLEIAREIYNRLEQLDECAMQAGMVNEHENSEEYEWCRCCGIIIEAVLHRVRGE